MKKQTKKKVLMIYMNNDKGHVGGVGQYRIISPGKALKELGYDIDIVEGNRMSELFKTGSDENELVDVYSNVLKTYDIIWMKHTDNEAALAAIFSMKDKFGCKVVWDFDDDLFAVKPSQPTAWNEYHPGSRKRDVVCAAVSMCDALTVSTQPLKESLSKLMKDIYKVDIPIYVCPNFINKEEWTNVKYRPSNSPVIGYFGSTTHNEDLEMIIKDIGRILEKYPRVSFEIIGALNTEDTIKLFSNINPDVLTRCRLRGGSEGYAEFPNLLLKQNWDFAIAPLTDDKFNRAKSHIKWMETAMKSIPVVASKVYPYITPILGTDVIQDEKTGLLAGKNEWFKQMSRLIESPELREKLGRDAKKFVLENWTKEHQIKHWSKTLDFLLQ